MSGTIAQLGLAVDSSEAAQAATDLERLAQAGVKAEKAADGVSAGFDKAATATAGLATAEGKLSESTDDAIKRLTAMAKASLDSSEYYQSLTTSVNTNATALDNSGSSASSLAALQRRLQAESDALVGSTDRQAEAAKKSAAATGVQAEGLQALLGKINPAVAALEKLDQQQAQLQKYKAAGLIDAETFRDYSARIDASRQKLGDFDDGLKKTGVSSKQTEAALRQLPAQFSDIFTSLVGGQNPLMVLIQQGSQIKDSFGGVGNTFDVLKDKFRSLFTGGAGAAVLGESLVGIAAGAQAAGDGAKAAGESLGGMAEGANTAADAAKNAKEAASALGLTGIPVSTGLGLIIGASLAAAAAIGVLIYGYSQGSKEASEYNKALILTGNYAGTSAGRLADLAQQVSATNGTTGEAAASLAKLAASGVVAGDSFKDIADAAAAMEDATGKSVDATIAEFVKIAKDPVAAAKELNDQYHFLNASVYSQIVALKEQGDTIGAAKLLTDTYADTVKSRSGEITANLGTIERAWKGIKDGAAAALDATLNIGRQITLAQQAQELERKLANPSSYSSLPILGEDNPNMMEVGNTREEDQKRLDLLKSYMEIERRQTKYEGERRQTEDDATDASKALHTSYLAGLDKEQKKKLEIEELDRRRAKALAGSNVDADRINREYAVSLQAINDKNKPPKASSAGAVDLTAFNTAQNALKEIQADYSNTQKQLDAAQKAGLISQQEYLLKREALIGNERDEVTAAYEAEITALEAAKGKATTTAEQRIQLDQKIADARTDMVKAQKAADSELEVLATNEQGRLRKQELAVKTYTSALQQQVDTLRQQGQRAAAGLGQGDRQRGLTDQQNAIDDRINSQKLDLANQYGDGSRGMSLDEYTQKLAALKTTQQDLHDTVQSNYDEMTDAQGSWSAGASSAWQNYLESARDVAGQTKSLFTNAFSSMEDAIVNFAMTGKLSFADFTKSILADMARIATRQASSALLNSLVGAATSYFTGSGATGSATAGGAEAGAQSFGSQFDASSASVSFGGGRAGGGGVDPNTLYEVNEKGPELFNQGGRSYLMTGANGGSVTPLTSGAGPGVAAISNSGGGSSISINAPVSVITQDRSSEGMQIDQQALQQNLQTQMKAAAERAVADSWRAGGVSFRNVNGRA